MTPRDLILIWSERFRAAGIPDPAVDASLLLSFLTERPPLILRLDADTELDNDLILTFESLAFRRLKREPLQYILREGVFCGRVFHVDPRVLIPRPETELLCEWAEDLLSRFDSADILDLCCGSGCIGISVKLDHPSVSVFCSDVSHDALQVARANASRLHADVRFVQGDLFSPWGNRCFHMIICNPPYIPSDDCLSLQPEVLREPLSALDGGPDGLSIYRRICMESPRHLMPGGILLMELGDGESDMVESLMLNAGFSSVTVRCDYQALPRMICGTLN